MNRTFFQKLCLFVLLTFVVDFTIGVLGQKLYDNARGGATFKIRYLSDLSSDSIVVFGSSRAVHHYVPRIIEDSTNISCFNAATDGSGIIYNYGVFSAITSRYVPKIVIYDICPKYDLFVGDNEKYLTNLKLYYGKGDVQGIFEDINYFEKIKMYSNMYKYNSKLLELWSDTKVPKGTLEKGYLPKFNVMHYAPKPNPDFIKEQKLDMVKLRYLSKLITDCKRLDIKLVFVVSPCYKYTNDSILNSAKDLAKKNNVPFIDHFGDTYISRDSKYWADGVHLNDIGAKVWTSLFVNELKNLKKC